MLIEMLQRHPPTLFHHLNTWDGWDWGRLAFFPRSKFLLRQGNGLSTQSSQEHLIIIDKTSHYELMADSQNIQACISAFFHCLLYFIWNVVHFGSFPAYIIFEGGKTLSLSARCLNSNKVIVPHFSLKSFQRHLLNIGHNYKLLFFECSGLHNNTLSFFKLHAVFCKKESHFNVFVT